MNEHKNCHGQWSGFEFQVLCYCECHNKKQRALVEVEGPETNAIRITQSPEEGIHPR
jgi:hypothetical protein